MLHSSRKGCRETETPLAVLARASSGKVLHRSIPAFKAATCYKRNIDSRSAHEDLTADHCVGQIGGIWFGTSCRLSSRPTMGIISHTLFKGRPCKS